MGKDGGRRTRRSVRARSLLRTLGLLLFHWLLWLSFARASASQRTLHERQRAASTNSTPHCLHTGNCWCCRCCSGIRCNWSRRRPCNGCRRRSIGSGSRDSEWVEQTGESLSDSRVQSKRAKMRGCMSQASCESGLDAIECSRVQARIRSASVRESRAPVARVHSSPSPAPVPALTLLNASVKHSACSMGAISDGGTSILASERRGMRASAEVGVITVASAAPTGAADPTRADGSGKTRGRLVRQAL